MAAADWIRSHRRPFLIAATFLLGTFVPFPGLFLSALFFPAGIHDLDTRRKQVEFLCIVFGVSYVTWALVLNATLPRKREASDR